MLCTTVQEMLQGKLDQQVTDHVLYLVGEKDAVNIQVNHPSWYSSSIVQQAVLEGKLDQLRHPILTLVSLDEVVFYIGKTLRAPRERLYEHIYQSRMPRKSNLGTFIIQNLPISLCWTVKLL